MNNRLRFHADDGEEDAGAFEAGGYRSAVVSFLREFLGNVPGAQPDIEDVSVHAGLKMIRKVIAEKSRARSAQPV